MNRSHYLSAALLSVAVFVGGCAQTLNPSFPESAEDGNADLIRMSNNPRSISRPLVICGGLSDPGILPLIMAAKLDKLTIHDRFVVVNVGDCLTIDDCRRKLIKAIEWAYPSGNPDETVAVDIVGFSLGGLTAEYAAIPQKDGGQTLKIARLFTISSPLQGAWAASYTPAFFPLIRQLRPGSSLMNTIAENPPAYPVYSYVRLGDYVIGPPNAANPGSTAWWVPTPYLAQPHNGAPMDSRIIADIARRLRDEPSLTQYPPAPLPAKG